MNVRDVAAITAKDLRTATRRRSIRVSLLLFPLIAAIGFPLVLQSAGRKTGGIPASTLPGLLDAFLFFFVIAAATLPTAIGAYSLVGEKVERSLEPLLATPVSDEDILLGKSLAAFVPSVLVTWVCAVLFMVISDVQTHATLGYLYFPNESAWIVVLVVVPLAAALSVAINVLVSARATDVRSAQQVGALPAIPFAALYVAGEIKAITLAGVTLLVVAAVLLVIVVALFATARSTFNREEILTRWK